MSARRVDGAIDAGLIGLALGRLALGALSRVAPKRAAEQFGVGDATGAEFDYMARIFGIRAIALGSGYLLSEGSARRLWQRLALMCDVSDTVAGVGELRGRELPRRSAAAVTAMTGTYAAIGAARLLRDVTRG